MIKYRSRILLAVLAVAVLGRSVVAAPAAVAGVADLEFVSGSSALDSSDSKVEQVQCPAGKVVLSGGAFLGGPAVGVHIDRLQPDLVGGAFFEAAASEWATPTKAAWRLSAYAICGLPPAGLQYVAAQSNSYDSPLRTALATCPRDKRVIGFGGRGSVESSRRVSLTAVLPSADLTRVVVQSYAEESGEDEDWTAEAYAVCADPIADATVVQSSAGPGPDGKFAWVDCGHRQLHAVGAGIFSGGGQVWFGGLYPAPDLRTGTALPVEDPTGTDFPWHVNVAGICA